ncbi:MAG TPA: hypothetical protein ENK05_11745 [Gammaproteobacteria bacterium]|nr:hypothetical protein [Gammaproteobacteria bacterium]
MAHWSEKYVGLPYVEGEMDCAGLAREVQRREFGRVIDLPSERAPGLRGLHRQIEALKTTYATPTGSPQDGDGVLMVSRGALDHIGIYCDIGGEPWVLHAMRGCAQVCLHRLRDLDGLNLTVEGFYQWLEN